MFGKTHTPESKALMSLAKKGKKSSFLGKIQDEEVKTKISEIRIFLTITGVMITGDWNYDDRPALKKYSAGKN